MDNAGLRVWLIALNPGEEVRYHRHTDFYDYSSCEGCDENQRCYQL